MNFATATRVLDRSYCLSLALALGLWSYAVLTTPIDSYEFRPFPIFYELPPLYWIGWGLLVLATISWYLSADTRNFHTLLALAWTLFLFVGPELMEVNARGNDTFGHLVGVTFYEQDMYREPYVSYSAFPGFHFLAIPLYKVTGVGYYELAKLLAASLHVVRLAAIWYLGSHLLKEKKAVLFFALLLLALLWDHQQLDPSNQNMGLIFMFFFLGSLFASETHMFRNRLLSIAFFAAAVVTHPLSAMVLIVLLFFFLVMGKASKRLIYKQATHRATLFLVCLVGFTAWTLYIADWVLPAGVEKMLSFVNDEGRSAVENVGEANERGSLYARLVYGFLGLLAIWGFAIAVEKKFFTQLSLSRVLPALSVLPAILPLSIGVWTIERYYLLSTQGIAWFFAQESGTRKYLAISLLIVVLGFAFVLRYYGEYNDYNPSEDFYASQFVAEDIPHSAIVYRGHKASPTFINLANVVDAPAWVDTGEVLNYKFQPGVDFQFALDSQREKNIVIFRDGQRAWNQVEDILAAGTEVGYVYTNGKAGVRAYQPGPGPTRIPQWLIDERRPAINSSLP